MIYNNQYQETLYNCNEYHIFIDSPINCVSRECCEYKIVNLFGILIALLNLPFHILNKMMCNVLNYKVINTISAISYIILFNNISIVL